MHRVSKIERILQTDLLTETFVVYPLPRLRQILGGDCLLWAGYIATADRDLYFGSARLNGSPVRDPAWLVWGNLGFRYCVGA